MIVIKVATSGVPVPPPSHVQHWRVYIHSPTAEQEDIARQARKKHTFKHASCPDFLDQDPYGNLAPCGLQRAYHIYVGHMLSALVYSTRWVGTSQQETTRNWVPAQPLDIQLIHERRAQMAPFLLPRVLSAVYSAI